MRTFFAILFTIALFFQVTVWAENKQHDKDDDDDAVVCDEKVKSCKADIVSIVDKLHIFNEELKEFKGTDGFAAAYSIHTAVKEVEDLIYKARYDCCAIPRKLTKDETDDILDLDDPIVTEIRCLLNTLLSYKTGLISNVLFPSRVLRNKLRNIQAMVQPLTTCLVDKAHDDEKDEVQETAIELDGIFSSAINAL